jgi:hypothetical protein
VMKIFRLVGLLVVVAALGGCGVLPFRQNLVVLATDRPEMAAVVEYFNSLPSDYRVVLSYRPNPVQVLLERTRSADLVLGSYLNGAASRRNLEALDDLFRREQIRREDFYESLLAGGREDKRQILLPFSFNVPAVVFAPGEPLGDMPNLAVDLDYLKQKSGQFNQSVRSRFVRVGYSPLWVPDFLFTVSSLFGVAFQEGAEGNLRWNSQALQAMQNSLSSWVVELNQGFEQDSAFARRYLYEPFPRLLDSRRILFYPTSSGELLDRLAEQDEEADFRWLRSAAGIPVTDDVLYFGIPRGTRNRRGARLFLAWIFQPETQRKLLEIKSDKRLRGFGLAGGFSALRPVSERYYPEQYRQLLGRLPPAEMLLPPASLPSRWGELKPAVVVPWLVELISNQAEEKDLTARLRDYREQRTDHSAR